MAVALEAEPTADVEADATVELNVDEAEVCYKGGKKYEILSNSQTEEVSGTTPLRQSRLG